jgi:hypothetical protein
LSLIYCFFLHDVGESVIRAALFNHRIEQIQVENLFDSVIRFGRELEQIGIPAEAYTAA